MCMTLSPDIETKIRQKVESGLYSTADEAIAAAISLLDEWDSLRRLRESLIEVEEQTRTGRVAEWTPELRQQLRARAEEMARQGMTPDPDVCP